jgi:CHAT domain-containing protein
MLLPGDVVPADAVDVAIVADDELSLIPFAALRSPSDPARRFAETHAITMVPTLLDTRATEAAPARRWRFVAVRGAESGDSVVSQLRGSPLFPPLPGAAAEVEAVLDRFARDRKGVQVLEGDTATVAGVRDLMTAGAEVMHFATHGHADLRHPIASLLSLPHGVWLTAGQIQEWQGNVGLVFLSACETAVGPTRFAEGMPGLQRAFLRAGAGNVVATLWPVEDGLAKQFAEAFYDELSNGIAPAQALARTQRRWISSASGESAQKGTRRRVAAWGYVLYAR